MALISQNQQSTFANPQNGQAPDADVVRNNDNALVAKHNAHDADATIHVQSGLLSARPAASTPYAMYVDENKRLYVDNGSVWSEVPYARLDAVGTNAFANDVTVGGTLDVSGALGVTGLLTANNLDVLDVDAANIVADSFTGGPVVATGNSSIAGTLTGLTGLTVTGVASATTFAGSGASLTNLSAAAVTSGTLDAARLPTLTVFPIIAGAATSPRNTIKLADSDTAFLTATSASTLVAAASGSGSTTTITGFNGPAGTTFNAGDMRYIKVTLSGQSNWYIPVLQFT